MKSFRVGALGLMAATALGSACTSGTTAPTGRTAACDKAPFTVGFVTDVGKLSDKSFNFDSYNGALDAQADSSLGVTAKAIESQAESDYAKNIQTFVDQKYCMILTNGFKLGDATIKAARANPYIAFAMVDYADFGDLGKPSHPGNLVGLEFQEDQPGFLVGALAGLMTKSNVIGSVAGLDIPPVHRYVTGFANGAKYTNPAIKVLNIYQPESGAKDFNDPDWGKQQAVTFFGQGADIIFGIGGSTGNGAILAAKEQGKMCIGVDVDQYVSYPDVDSCLISSAQIGLRQIVKLAITNMVKGTWSPGLFIGNLQNGGVTIAPYHDWDSKIPASVKARIADIKAKLTDGTLKTGA